MNSRTANGWKLAAFALALTPALALADARIEARRHFQNGMGLIARGDFDEGVSELKEAYAIKPHPNVLYNIARAYLDAGRVPEALEYYRKYLATNPPDSDAVRQSVQRLEQSVASSQPKPLDSAPAPSPLVEPLTPPSRGGGQVDPDTVKRLNALADRLETALDKLEKKSEGAGSSSTLSPAPLVAASDGTETAQSAASEGASDRPYEEQVVTASRRAQSTLEAPNATYVITAEEIRLSGATTLVELLRRVPGADVMVMGAGSANVSLRGFNQRLANKVLVLVDGRTEYQDFLGLTIWSAIPVGLEEIDRIEVIRGPGSALYGANAMLGVINIITRQPGTGPVAELDGRVGTGNNAYGTFIHSARAGALSYRASVAYDQADRFSRDFSDNRPDVQSNLTDSSTGRRSARGNFNAVWTFSPDFSIGASAGVNRFFTELYPPGILRSYYLDGTEAYVKTDVNAGPFKLKLFWNHLDGTAGPEYTPIGERPLDVQGLSSNVFDAELLYSKEFTLLGEHHLVLGAEGRLKRVGFGYLAGFEQELHASIYGQDEWRIVEPLRVVASYRLDRAPLLDNGNPGYAQSPRISLVWIPTEGQALRAGFSTAFREPTFLESYTDIRIPVPGVNGASAFTQGNTQLKPEYLTAWELGYRGDLAGLGLEYDVAAYWNTVQNLIVLSGVNPLPAGQAYDPVSQSFLLGRSNFVNEADVYTARGVELGARYSPIDGLDLRASAAFQSVTSNNAQGVCGPCTEAPAAKVYGGASYRSRAGFDFSADVAYVSPTVWVEREPDAIDPTQIDNTQYPLDAYTVINARVAYRFWNDKAQLALSGTNLGTPHAEHPFGNRITQRFFLMLTVTP